MALVFMDGFDHQAFGENLTKYTYSGGINQGFDEDGEFSTELYYGPDLAKGLMNTGFGRVVYDYNFGRGAAQSTILFGCHLRAGNTLSGTFNGNGDFFQLRYEHNVSPFTMYKQCALVLRDNGRIEVWRSGTVGNLTGTKVAETAAAVVTTTFAWFEFLITSPTGVKIWKDGVLILDEPLINTYDGAAPATGFSRVGFVWENFGFAYFVRDNYYLKTDTTRLGEIRITTNYPSSHPSTADIASTSFTAGGSSGYVGYTNGTLPALAGRILERKNSPFNGVLFDDGDASYITTSATGSVQMRFERWYPIGGVIHGLAINIVAKQLVGGTGRIRPYIYGNGVTIGSWQDVAFSSSYTTLQWIYALDPELGNAWREEDFNTGLWTFGFEAEVGLGDLRVTQFSIERAHSIGTGSGAEYSIRGSAG